MSITSRSHKLNIGIRAEQGTLEDGISLGYNDTASPSRIPTAVQKSRRQ